MTKFNKASPIDYADPQSAEPHPHATTHVDLVIDGLVANGDGTFTLRDVPITQPDYPTITTILTAAGIERIDAERLVDDFADNVFVETLAKVLARRTRRTS